MNPAARTRRPLAARVLPSIALIALLAACTPAPEPRPTPTAAFATEEEAFAAAEETYRAYADASNNSDLLDPSTFDLVYLWLLDEAEVSARENYSEYHANGITRTGSSSFYNFTPVSFDGEAVLTRLCLNVSDVELMDGSGRSVVPPDRQPLQSIEVRFVQAATPTGLGIQSMVHSEDSTC